MNQGPYQDGIWRNLKSEGTPGDPRRRGESLFRLPWMSDWATVVAAIGGGAVSFLGGAFAEQARSRSERRADVDKRKADSRLRREQNRSHDLLTLQDESLKMDATFGDYLNIEGVGGVDRQRRTREVLRRQAGALEAIAARIHDQELNDRVTRYFDAISAASSGSVSTLPPEMDEQLRQTFADIHTRVGELLAAIEAVDS